MVSYGVSYASVTPNADLPYGSEGHGRVSVQNITFLAVLFSPYAARCTNIYIKGPVWPRIMAF